MTSLIHYLFWLWHTAWMIVLGVLLAGFFLSENYTWGEVALAGFLVFLLIVNSILLIATKGIISACSQMTKEGI